MQGKVLGLLDDFGPVDFVILIFLRKVSKWHNNWRVSSLGWSLALEIFWMYACFGALATGLEAL